MNHLVTERDVISSNHEAFEAADTGFVSPVSPNRSLPKSAIHSLKSGQPYSRANARHSEPIWLARHVDWPVYTPISTSSAIPYSTISSALYQKLWRSSRKAGETLGINGNSSSSFSSFIGGSTTNNANTIHANNTNTAQLDSNDDEEDHGHTSGGYYTALGGLMGRVFTGSGIGGQHHSTGMFSFTCRPFLQLLHCILHFLINGRPFSLRLRSHFARGR